MKSLPSASPRLRVTFFLSAFFCVFCGLSASAQTNYNPLLRPKLLTDLDANALGITNASRVQSVSNTVFQYFQLTNGAAAGRFLISDANGVATWGAASGDAGALTNLVTTGTNIGAGVPLFKTKVGDILHFYTFTAAGDSGVLSWSTNGTNCILTFSGTNAFNASGATNLQSANLVGTVPIGIMPVVTNVWADAQYPNAYLLDGTRIGNGFAFTNLNATNLTGVIPLISLPVPTNVWTDAQYPNAYLLDGTRAGNGFAFTNLNATNLTGVIPLISLPVPTNTWSDSQYPNALLSDGSRAASGFTNTGPTVLYGPLWKFTNGAGSGKVWQSDADGAGSWQTPGSSTYTQLFTGVGTTGSVFAPAGPDTDVLQRNGIFAAVSGGTQTNFYYEEFFGSTGYDAKDFRNDRLGATGAAFGQDNLERWRPGVVIIPYGTNMTGYCSFSSSLSAWWMTSNQLSVSMSGALRLTVLPTDADAQNTIRFGFFSAAASPANGIFLEASPLTNVWCGTVISASTAYRVFSTNVINTNNYPRGRLQILNFSNVNFFINDVFFGTLTNMPANNQFVGYGVQSDRQSNTNTAATNNGSIYLDYIKIDWGH